MNTGHYQWAVVGAGPAGIAAVGRLLDSGVPAAQLLWLDPHFQVGDMGQYWRNVSSNTTVRRFLDFLQASLAFNYANAPVDFRLNHLEAEKTCCLNDVVEPLQWVTKHLQSQVMSVCGMVQRLSLSKNQWCLSSEKFSFFADKVVLATGAAACQFDEPTLRKLPSVPFDVAIDKQKLSGVVNKQNTYAVIGSSHSAIMIIRSLVELGVKKVINFYRSPCCYAIDQGDWILFDNTGLKGDTASWARDHIDGVLPANLERYVSNATNIARYGAFCQHVIHAVGFSQRRSVLIEGYPDWAHNPHHGIIAPGLFGFGIGFPESAMTPLGDVELQVGLWKFMGYLNKVLPLWLSYRA